MTHFMSTRRLRFAALMLAPALAAMAFATGCHHDHEQPQRYGDYHDNNEHDQYSPEHHAEYHYPDQRHGDDNHIEEHHD